MKETNIEKKENPFYDGFIISESCICGDMNSKRAKSAMPEEIRKIFQVFAGEETYADGVVIESNLFKPL